MKQRRRSKVTTPLLNSGPVYWLLKLLLNLWRLIPYPYSARLGGSLMVLISRFLTREKMIMDAQIEYAAHNCPKGGDSPLAACTDEGRRAALLRDVFAHTGRIVAESIIIPKLLEVESNADSEEPVFRYIQADHDPLFLQLAREGKGSIVISAHLGCFELLAGYYVKRGVPVTVIGRSPNYSAMDKLLRSVRSSYGVDTIWREEKGGSKDLLRAIRSNRCISPLIDQDIDLNNVFMPFFGLEAAHPSGPIRIAVKNKLPIFCAWILRLPSDRHRTVVKQIHYDAGDPNAENAILREYCRRIEKVISEHPEQWLWWHRRWRRRPGIDYDMHPDELPGTKAYVAWIRGLSEGRRNTQEI